MDSWLVLAGTEVANSARLDAYLSNVDGGAGPSPLTSVTPCGCPTLTAEALGDEPYVAPDVDPAPWWDPAVPESGDYLGLLVLSVDGLDDRPVARAVTRGITGTAALGRARVQPRTITVTGLILASSCCGADYGLRWLGEALAGGCGPSGCDGADLRLAACCPAEEPEDAEEFDTRYGRTIRRVALTQGPTAISRVGDGCGSDGGECQAAGADIVTVEFILTAAVPWAWTTPEVVLDVPVPRDDSDECIQWCVHDTSPEPPPEPVCMELADDCPDQGVEFSCDDCPPGSLAWPDGEPCPEESPPEPEPCDEPCRLAACPDPEAACADPTCRTPTPPAAPPPQTCYCAAVAVEQECYDLDLSDRPARFAAAPLITVEAGSTDLRRLTIAIYQRTADHDGLSCAEVAEVERCNPHSVYEVGYVPAGGTLELDGQVRRATVTCGGVSESSANVYGRDGAPPSWELLCSGAYCVCLSADAIFPPAPDATVTITLSGREY